MPKINQEKEKVVRNILKLIGENPYRAGLKDTPKRVVQMWKEIFRGYDPKLKPKLRTFLNGENGVAYNQMIVDSGYFFSYCEHHMVPFFGQYYFSYIPDKKIIGLSKIARVIDYYSARLQIQERLVKDAVDELEKALKPKGIGLWTSHYETALNNLLKLRLTCFSFEKFSS
ncbi:GTP cyclohydrolase I [Patescibacteria group bacterium]|nr:GTP cyclohydrolase I [Patescibacteria group bacterium]MBU2010059.1 GTP cyclohydrolase I [Patescibacteria group bacterium]MBU2416480.1 GTP cyclohydrolase I [Patescibacteria group bacterium]